MMRKMTITSASFFLLGITLMGCNTNPKTDTAKEAENLEAARGLREADEHGEGEGEEDGTLLAMDEVYDVVTKGTHLVLKYDQEAKAFLGTVENVSDEILARVRVKVHLSSGKELGPSVAADLEPGEKREVELMTGDEVFESWSTHAEVGDSEHSHEGESEHGHSHEDGGHEHN
jgi:hypothetical protein